MIYYVKQGENLYTIAEQFKITVRDLLDINVICNPSRVPSGLVVIIPDSDTEQLPKVKAGAHPYYVMLRGDSLYCLSKQLNITVDTLVQSNQIQEPNRILQDTELLIPYSDAITNPEELQKSWIDRGNESCYLENLQALRHIYRSYYYESFEWEAMGSKSIPYLLNLINHSCQIIRQYCVFCFGRLALNREEIIKALTDAANHDSSFIAESAKLAMRRIELVKYFGKRVHLTTYPNHLYSKPNQNSSSIPLPEGSLLLALRYNILGPVEETFRDISVYDYVMLQDSDTVGYLPRGHYRNILFI